MNLAIISTSLADHGYLRPLFPAFGETDWCKPSLLEAPCQEWEGSTPAEVSNIFAIVQRWAVETLPKFDAVALLGDRWDCLAVASAAVLCGVPIIHLAAGDKTEGSYDDRFRWAITSMSDLALCLDDGASDRVAFGFRTHDIDVRTVGSPSLDELLPLQGTAASQPPVVLSMCRPATATGEDVSEAVSAALSGLGADIRWFGSAPDVGADYTQEEGRLPRDEFIRLLAGSSVVVGNSSCGVLEAPFVGVPSVNVGTRQQGRFTAPSVVNVNNDVEEIRAAVLAALEHGRYEPNYYYGRGDSARRVVEAVRAWWRDR